MSTTRAIASNTAIQLTGKVISTFLGIVALSLMAQYLQPERYGWYTAVIGLMQFIGIMTDFGMTPVTAQMLSEPHDDTDNLLSNILSFRLYTAIFFFALAPLLALLMNFSRVEVVATAIASVQFIAIAMNQVLLGFYQTKLKLIVHSIAEVVSRIALVIGIALVIFYGEGFLWLMAAIAIAALIFTGIMLLQARQMSTLKLRVDFTVWKHIMKKGWPIAAAVMVNTVYLKGDILILTQFVSSTELGFYGAAYRIVDVVSQSAMMVMGILLPLMAYSWSRKQLPQFHKRLQQSFDLMMLLAVPLTVGALLVAKPLVIFVTDASYAPSGPLLQILTLAVFGVYLGAVFGHAAVAMNKQKQVVWVYASNALLTLIGYMIFIPRYGVHGAAWMSVFSELYTGIILMFVIFHWAKKCLSFARATRIILSTLVMAAIIHSLSGMHVLLQIFIGMAVFGGAAILLQAIPKQTLISLVKKNHP